MREFPNATARPWKFVATPKPDSTEVWVELVAKGGLVIGEPYYHGQPEDHDNPEANAALIVHAVNTYEERERLLEEAAKVLRRIAVRTQSPVDGDTFEDLARDLRHANGTARAFLAKLEARDA